MEAVILAGGLGTRLRGVIRDLPKPMAPVAGRPFLALLLDRLVAAGFSRAVLSVGYRHQVIRDGFGDHYRGLALDYAVESRPLGTGGAIRLALGQTRSPQVFVINGDTFLELDYRAMLDAHGAADARLSVAAQRVMDTARYGALEIREGRIRGFLEKGRSGPGVINGGVYLLSPDLFDAYPQPGTFSFETDLMVPHVRELAPLAFPCDGLFIDIGVPEDYARAQQLLAAADAGPA